VSFGNQIDLIGLEQPQAGLIGDVPSDTSGDATNEAKGRAVVLYWQARATISEDYSLFVHWLDASGHVLAQSDAMPNAGHSPTTLWRVGDVVRDVHILPPNAAAHHNGIPNGVHSVHLGIYLLSTLERLPAYQAGSRLPGDAVTIALQDVAISHD
jgi:hypothetical protein